MSWGPRLDPAHQSRYESMCVVQSCVIPTRVDADPRRQPRASVSTDCPFSPSPEGSEKTAHTLRACVLRPRGALGCSGALPRRAESPSGRLSPRSKGLRRVFQHLYRRVFDPCSPGGAREVTAPLRSFCGQTFAIHRV